MTTTQDTTGTRVSLQTAAPGFARAMAQLQRASTTELAEAGIEPLLAELVKIRASQLNGCTYCLDMHAKDARAAGETEQRVYALPTWREAPFYTARERAALAFAESVTLVAGTHVPDADYAAVAAEFSEREVAALLTAIVTINSSIPGTGSSPPPAPTRSAPTSRRRQLAGEAQAITLST